MHLLMKGSLNAAGFVRGVSQVAGEEFSGMDTVEMARRFGGVTRLVGAAGMTRLRAAHVTVAGLGGVGSWCAEALARSGVGALTLIDLDHIAESNVNRQVHALSDTLGQAKTVAMQARLAQINPHCVVTALDNFVAPDNVEAVIALDTHVLVDCTDQISAKLAMVRLAVQRRLALLVCGAAGGKTDPYRLRAGDLAHASHDALLRSLRQKLRRDYGFAQGAAGRKPAPRMGVRCLWVDQPTLWPGTSDDQVAPQGLSCAGYGSAVTVTASMGLAAAHEAMQAVLTV